MELQNSTNQPTSNKRLFIIIGLFVVIVSLSWFIFRRYKNSTNVPQPNEYYDNRSGETVSNPKNKTPESYGSTTDEPIYLGISKLLEYGVTNGQLQATQQAFSAYSKSVGSSIREVSIEVSSIKSLPTDASHTSSRHSLTFNVQFNRDKIYYVQLDYFGVNSIQLYLKDSSGKVIYNSGAITWSNDQGD